MRKIIAAAVLAVLLLTGCGPKEGDVVDKRWKPDLSYWGVITQCTSYGNRTQCNTVPHWYYVPARYILILRVETGEIKDKDVRRSVYYSINVGDHYQED